MPVIKKVILNKSKITAPKKESLPTPVVETRTENQEGTKARTKRYCHFCKTKTEPRYWDAASLRRCLNDRGRIIPKARTGSCAKHQRQIGREIKRARHLALLPFTVNL